MNIIENAIWQVESNLRRALTLEDVASSCRVTPSHLTRAFASATGTPLMRYARSRRLTEAARVHGTRRSRHPQPGARRRLWIA